jgi:uncharacterized OB-fold protein
MTFPKVIRNEASAGFFDAAAGGALLLQRCADCETALGPEAAVCHSCESVDLGPLPAAGTGHLVSWSVVHRAPTPWLAPAAPYVVGTVELAEGPRVFARLLVAPETVLAAGLPLECRFIVSGTPEDPGEVLPAFEPVDPKFDERRTP